MVVLGVGLRGDRLRRWRDGDVDVCVMRGERDAGVRLHEWRDGCADVQRPRVRLRHLRVHGPGRGNRSCVRAERDKVVRLRRWGTDGCADVQRHRVGLFDLWALHGREVRGRDVQRHGDLLVVRGRLRRLHGSLRRRDVQRYGDLLVVRGRLRGVRVAALRGRDLQRERNVLDVLR